MSEALLTIEDLQKRWRGCSARTIERYRQQGLVSVRLGGVRFRIEDVEAFEESRATGKPAVVRRQRRLELPKLKHLTVK